MDSLPSLTQREAAERAALIEVQRYDIEADLTDLLDGSDFRAVSTIRFSCRSAGASTFVDAAVTVTSASLNGVDIAEDRISTGRIELTGLAEDNLLVVASVQSETAAGEWVHRSVDPADKEVYVWTSFEPDDARRAWACFDQPDLKAPHHFTVVAPAPWIVVSNSGDPVVTQHPGGGRRWDFPDTPPLSTYIPVINAGPFHEIRSERNGFDLGLFARRSLARFLDRDAEEIFDITAAGLTFYGDRFGLAFPQHKYDQVFLPDMGGAMENFGCVTWSDAFVYRSSPTYTERENRALVLLHEMAHMWFGDMVTMQWWEDLWLNEAFAEWACYWAAEAATPFTDAWSSFLAGEKLEGYAADMAPTTHPIRQPAADVAAAAASFDGITYPKGASVLKQLFAFVGEDACVAGLRGYFAKYAWGNTRLVDLMGELGLASGRDLTGWTEGWLDTAGTDRLSLDVDGPGAAMLRTTGPGGIPPRPHRLDVGVYDRPEGDRSLVRRHVVSLETTGPTTRVPDVGGAALLLVNDEDLTFASVRPDASSLRTMLDSAAGLPTAVSRGVAVTTAWDMLVWGELSAADFVRCVTGVLANESVDSVIEPYLSLAVEAADSWSPDVRRDALLERVADVCLALATDPVRRHAAVRALAQTAVTESQIAELRTLVGDDVDLRWRLLARLAEIGSADPAEVERLTHEDPDPDAWVRALVVDSARPDPQCKEATWRAIVEEHRVPMGSLRIVSDAFWRRSQGVIVAPYADRYLEILPTLHLAGMIPALGTSRALYPRAGVGAAFVDRAVAAANADGVSPVVSKRVIELTDRLNRMLTARTM
ncbi:MAG TPA: aminopeptidase N [Micromonosporaceae bacterium]|nr:aminopeptidase N [Micromonosporaceae bacterium]